MGRWGRCALLAGIYFACGKLGLWLASEHENVSPVWPPTGIALAALLLGGTRLWPGVALGAWLVNATTDVSLGTASGIALGNTLEAWVGAALLRRFGFRNELERSRDALALLAFAALVSTKLSATIGVASLCLSGSAPWSEFLHLWWPWWVGDALGNLVVASFVLAFASRPPSGFQAGRAIEAGALGLGLLCVVQFVFGWRAGHAVVDSPYWILPFLIWAALRFGPRGATGALGLVSAVAIANTWAGLGPFAAGSQSERLIMVQAFLGVASVTSLVLAGAASERRHAQVRLAESEERYRQLFEKSSAGVASSTLDGRFLDCNEAFHRMLGYDSKDELLARPAEAIYPRVTDRQAFVSALLREGRIATHERELRRKDGSSIWVVGSITLVRGGGRGGPTLQGTIVDVTIRRRARVEIERQKSEIDQASRLIMAGQMAAAMAHEVSQPLSAAANFLESAARGLRPGAEAGRKEIDALRHAGERIAAAGQILRRTLSFVRPREPGKTPLDVDAAAHRALQVFRSEAAARSVELRADPGARGARVAADPVQIEEVFSNLICNAIEAVDLAGSPVRRVTVETRAEEDGSARVAVIDTGPGVPAAARAELFEAFRSRKPGGLGLGLWICRNIVEAHGGTIGIVDTGGRGAHFEFRLPASPRAS